MVLSSVNLYGTVLALHTLAVMAAYGAPLTCPISSRTSARNHPRGRAGPALSQSGSAR
jgi:hypothetical protein